MRSSGGRCWRSRWSMRCSRRRARLDGGRADARGIRARHLSVAVGASGAPDDGQVARRAPAAARSGGHPPAGRWRTVDSPSPGRPRPGAGVPARRSGGGLRWSDRSCRRTVRWTPFVHRGGSLDPRVTRESRGRPPCLDRRAHRPGVRPRSCAPSPRSAQRLVSSPMPARARRPAGS